MADNRATAGELNPGADLKTAREARGLSVHQVAVELHVSDAFILALERGDYAVLGEPVFVRGHLRNYARAVGVAESQVLATYEQTQNKPAPPPLVTQHTPGSGMSPRAREWSMRLASAGVIVVLLVLAVSWWMRRPDETAALQATDVVQPAATPAPAASSAPVATLTDLSDKAAAPQTAPQKEPPKPAAAVVPPPVPAAKTSSAPTLHEARAAAPAPAPARVQQVAVGPGDAKNLTRVKFTLGAASWIEVYDNNGKRLYYDLAPAGDSLELSGTGPLQVFLGNAPGVSLELNGAPFDLKPYARPDKTARFKLGEPGN
jgi:cytoskeleton protein RodZ